MNQKRFVESYLSAMMKAATGGRIVRLSYTSALSNKLSTLNVVTVTLDNGSVVPICVDGKDLLGIAEIVLETAKRERERELPASSALRGFDYGT